MSSSFYCFIHIRIVSQRLLLLFSQAQQDVYANVELSGFSDGNDDESDILELKQKALLLDIVHNVHIVEELIQSQAANLQDWSWQKQLRWIC